MKRRTLLSAAAATLALPAIARAAASTTIRFVPAADVPSLGLDHRVANPRPRHAHL